MGTVICPEVIRYVSEGEVEKAFSLGFEISDLGLFCS